MNKKPILMVLALMINVVLLVNGCVMPWAHSKSLYLDTASDGLGGILVVLEDENEAYGQRIDSEGNIRWGDGIKLNTIQCWHSPQVTGDGSGGAFIIWCEAEEKDGNYSNFVTYMQKVTPDGEILWGQGGKPVPGSELPFIVPDGYGGAIIIQMWRSRIQLRRIDSEGNLMWGEKGVTVCTTRSTTGGDPVALADGTGGAIIAWEDDRAGGPRNDIYAQRVNSEGEIIWQEDGIPVSVPCYGQNILRIVSDGSDGAIVAWKYNNRDPSENHVHAQRLSPDGEALWQEDGVQVNTVPSTNFYPHTFGMASDGAGGAIIAWPPSRSGDGLTSEEETLLGLRAQRVDSEGKLQWPEEARLFINVNVSGRSGSRGGMLGTSVVADSSGGAIVIGVFQSTGPLPRAQKLSPDGELLWKIGGVQLFPDPQAKSYEDLQVMSDGSGGALVVAEAGRKFRYDEKIYAQRIDTEGGLLWKDEVQVYP